MEYIIEKIGMSRTIAVPSVPVTLLRVLEAKVCEVNADKRALVSYVSGKKMNKAIAGQQKKYNLSAAFNRFVTLDVANAEAGDLDTAPLGEAKTLKVSLNTKGRGFAGVIKRHNFQGGPGGHGSRFTELLVQSVTVNGRVVFKKARKCLVTMVTLKSP